jgi:DNA-binding Xre family transcriptional regulator
MLTTSLSRRAEVRHNCHIRRTLGCVGRGTRVPALRRLRVAKLWKQSDLAERAGVSRTTVARLEAEAHKHADFETVQKLADALGVEPSELMAE